MIERATIGGREATVAYVSDAFEPVSRNRATLIKIIFDDGEIVFARRSGFGLYLVDNRFESVTVTKVEDRSGNRNKEEMSLLFDDFLFGKRVGDLQSGVYTFKGERVGDLPKNDDDLEAMLLAFGKM